jgi:conjugal transfer/entry exclusion protein
MDRQAMGEALERGLRALVITVAVVTAVVVGVVTHVATRIMTPSYEDVLKEKAREAVLKQLTQEQREILGEK